VGKEENLDQVGRGETRIKILSKDQPLAKGQKGEYPELKVRELDAELHKRRKRHRFPWKGAKKGGEELINVQRKKW